jgi:hypothetical protein
MVGQVKPSAERQQAKLEMVETAMREPDCGAVLSILFNGVDQLTLITLSIYSWYY